MRSPVRALAVALVVTAAVSACGLKQDVKDQLAQGQLNQGGIGVGEGPGVVTDPGTGPSAGPGAGPGTGPGTVTGPGTGGGNQPGTGGGNQPGTGGGNQPGTNTPVGGTTIGIDTKNKVINIALHGPLTGAGVPQQSFTTGTPKYWANRKLSNGYTVKAVAIDDKYNAADALRACNAASKENFMVIGGAGTDQISACAQSPVLRRTHTPYLSAGVTEAGLGNIPTYFATSLTYKEQAPLLIKLAKDRGYFGKKWAMVITGTPNFTDARQAMVQELTSNGAKGSAGAFDANKDVFLTDKAPTNCASLASSIRGGGYEVVYFLGQPSFFAQCVGSIGNVPVNPIYTGPGPSFGINSVINLACKANPQYEGYYLHPTPSHNQRAKYGAPDDLTDDIEVGIWGAMQQLHQSLEMVLKGGPLTRERFIEVSNNATIPGGVFTPVKFTANDHFGGTAAYANAALCPQGISNTVGTYRK